MHLALLHDGRPALLRVEGPAGAPVALFFHPFPLNADVWSEMLAACAASGLCAAALDAPGFGGTPPLGRLMSIFATACGWPLPAERARFIPDYNQTFGRPLGSARHQPRIR